MAKKDAEKFDRVRQAAEQGDASAQYSVGDMYFEGRGVSRDNVQAVKWYRLAAKQGYTCAQCSLGFMYKEG